MYKKALKKAGRYVYKKTGLKNPIKKGRLSSTRVAGNALKMARMYSDVAMLKNMINAEKKRVTIGTNNTAVGQVNGNTLGAYCVDITPAPAEGVTYSTRNGSSIKWISGYCQLQLIHQISTQSTIKGSIYFVQVVNQTLSTSTFISQFFNPSPFITSTSIYDDNCTRNIDYFKDFKVLKRKRFTVKCDQISGQTVQNTIKLPLKFGHHVKYSGDTQTVTDGQVMMLIVTDSGNLNSATQSTVGNISVTAVSTGLNLCWSMTNYFIDN